MSLPAKLLLRLTRSAACQPGIANSQIICKPGSLKVGKPKHAKLRLFYQSQAVDRIREERLARKFMQATHFALGLNF